MEKMINGGKLELEGIENARKYFPFSHPSIEFLNSFSLISLFLSLFLIAMLQNSEDSVNTIYMSFIYRLFTVLL